MDTKKFKVFVTRPIPQNGTDLLKQHFDVEIREEDSPISREDLEEGIKNCDAILTILTDKIDGELMDLNPNLKIISNYAVGYNNIDVEAATARKIPVSNTPGVLTQSTAEHAMALTLALAKRVVEGDKIMRRNDFPGWGPMYMLGTELSGKTVGVIGCGRIGEKFAEMMHNAFGCKILYSDRYGGHKEICSLGGERVDLETLLKESDIVSVHVPLAPETTHLIGTEEFKKMKKTALLINTARGPIVDEEALKNALKTNEIGGAAIDVFEYEPKLSIGLEELDNLVMTPHTASATLEARSQMAEVAAQNIIGILMDGQEPVSIVNRENL